MEQEAICKLVSEYEGPAYLFRLARVRERAALIREKLGGAVGLCYAMKANPFLVGEMSNFVDRIEVCSPGEYEICMAQGVPPEKLIVSGVNKTEASMRRILKLGGGKGIFTIESEKHFKILSALASERGLILKVLIRLTSGNQFGVDEATFLELAKRVKEDAGLTLLGVHFFSGTQKKKRRIEKELDMLAAFSERIRELFGEKPPELEYGPGLGVSYFQNDTGKEKAEAEPSGQLSHLCGCMGRLSQGQRYGKVTVELGRFLTAECGTYITKVCDVKPMEHGTHVIVDGGIHQMTYYGQMMGMKLPYMSCLHLTEKGYEKELVTAAQEGKEICVVCGSLCSINDVMLRELPLTHIQEGDLLMFENCGAYSMTEGIALFLSRELPAVWLQKENGELVCLRGLTEINYLNGGKTNG